MATFAKSSFNTAIYAAARPTYSPKLFEYIYEYYRNQPLGSSAHWDRAVDVGCGTGQAASHLDGVFNEVVCVDPSTGMLEKAREASATNATANTKFTFARGSAEDIPSTQEGSVDLLIAGMYSYIGHWALAFHWFDWQKVWPETKRVLRPQGGVSAFWVYGESQLSNFPSLTPRITEFWQGTDRSLTTSVGAYFQRPRRTVLEGLLVDVPAPSAVLPRDVGLAADISLTDAPQIVHPTIMKVDWRWIDVLAYLRTSSALHSYHEALPEDKRHSDGTRSSRYRGTRK
ncbi:S-adenosyl-L-methionine-dependent methyltransferase [Ephemerocybe angulata]|uniref:S-adenosyl-L-methionine-dependent methyltransferase n=1 Tax=Ephemerocybe angulata TaxID=980116 RepID=A0A8H6HKF6_9AGAR|nr:S-adenosyl-L-methionine-dependent methyltransferase [Tulosesus angulatus]